MVLVGDDTVDGHSGPKVYGKARHRDPVRSTHSHTAWRYGHKCVVLAVLVKFPFATRRWALPVLIDLSRAPALNQAEKRRHRTPAQLMCRLQGASDNTIGGTALGTGNVLSGNGYYGLYMEHSGQVRIQGNRVGTNAAGTAAVPNLLVGVGVAYESAGILIGGTTPIVFGTVFVVCAKQACARLRS